MPAKDIYHDAVRNALIKEGWTITDDPLILSIGKRDLFVDLGAEKLITAEKDHQKIAVEIKSFIGKSRIDDLEKALGQYIRLLAKFQKAPLFKGGWGDRDQYGQEVYSL
ncbi:element excision factor XisH family protein [Planktothricoides raciborskii]|uniref:element excision factor XisH family protein n=1 Tax=Planktothricoides raciborskii TaxID=132608 RepID=UPI0018EFEC06|nr:element excision factor XisH family protein [Planktothricoides raciborskii]